MSETREQRRLRKGCAPKTGLPLDRSRGHIIARSESELPADVLRDIRNAQVRRQTQQVRREWSPHDRDWW